MRKTLLQHKAFFNSEKNMTEFVRRSGGLKTLLAAARTSPTTVLRDAAGTLQGGY